jgi:Cdc6-like AAA superfamily ATPase
MVTPYDVFRPGRPLGLDTHGSEAEFVFQGRLAKRQELLQAILRPGHHALVHGEISVGKTSLVNVMGQALTASAGQDDPAGALLLRVDCHTDDTLSSLFKRVFRSVAVPEAVPIGFLACSPPPYVSLDRRLGGELRSSEVAELLSRVSFGRRLLVVVDELDRLPRAVGVVLADVMKALCNQPSNVTFVLVGLSAVTGALIDAHPAIRRHLTEIQVPRLSLVALEDVLWKGFERLGRRIEASDVRRVALLAKGLPDVVHRVGLLAAIRADDEHKETIRSVHIDHAIRQILQERQSFAELLRNLAQHQSRVYEVLVACALTTPDGSGTFSARAAIKALGQFTGRPRG